MLARMNVGSSNEPYAVEAPDSSYRLTPYDPPVATNREKAAGIMRRYRFLRDYVGRARAASKHAAAEAAVRLRFLRPSDDARRCARLHVQT